MATTEELTRTDPEREPVKRRIEQIPDWVVYVVLAAVAYVPLLFTSPGKVGADTKTYLYEDPGRLIQSAASLWDPNIGMGTVTHQTIGYLLPMGPFYWAMHHLGLPTWVAQRIWLGSLLFFAGAGTMYLLKVLGVRGPGRPVAALAYMLSPYFLEYAARISAILMPWSGLPWMIGLAIMALRRGGWRYPALFALVVAVIGGVNATSLLYAGVAPVLWFPFAVLVLREATWKKALAATARIGILTIGVSLWWAAGLWVQGAFGLDVLRYTETVKTVARTSLSSEVLRGLGYWFFYGQDKLGPWIQPAVDYTQRLWLIGISFALPALAFLAAALVRWRYRAYFVLLIVVGTIMAVGLYPYGQPTPLGHLLKSAATGSTVGLAMRSTGRAVPLVILGTAVLLGVGLSAVVGRARAPRMRFAAIGAVGAVTAMVLANIFPLWAGTIIGGNLERPEQIPSYYYQAADYLDTQGVNPTGGYQTRVLAIPGSDFASYRWGNTVDPVEPGLMNRPFVAREIFPYGTAGSVDLLDALDTQLQQGVFVPASLAPIASLMSVGDVLLRSDLQYERYNTPRPKPTWAMLNPPPPGLAPPKGFGTPVPNVSTQFPLLDEIALAAPPNQPNPPPVATFAVAQPRSIVRADPAAEPLLVDGDGQGLVYAAGTGLLNTDAAILYSPSMAGDPAAMQRALSAGGDLLVTDTNRKQARRSNTVRENVGYIETANEKPGVYDPSDQRLPLFPSAGTDAYTVAQQTGVESVVASEYGNDISYTPEDRPSNALDGDLRTAWKAEDFGDPVGQWIRVTLNSSVTTDHMTLVQPVTGSRNRWITTATLTFDGGNPVTVSLGPASRTASGQVVSFPTRSFKTLQITVDGTNTGPRSNYEGLSGVGFAEIAIPGVHFSEAIRLPEDLLDAAGQSSLSHRLTILVTRDRAAPTPPRSDPELTMVRVFGLPTSRAFNVSGTARISASAPDNVIDQLLGEQTNGIVATSSTRLPGDIDNRASSAIDGNPGTFWSPALGSQEGQWVEYDLPQPVTLDHMNLSLVADGRHSVPTKIQVSAGSETRTVDLPPVNDVGAQNGTVQVPVSFAPISGQRIRVTVEAVRAVRTIDYYSGQPITLPVGIAELGAPGISASPPPAQFASPCRSDLLSVDGQPVDVAVSGTTAAASNLDGLNVVGCGNSQTGLSLGPGNHTLRTADGSVAGINVDQMMLSSAPGGGPLATPAVPAQGSPNPAATLTSQVLPSASQPAPAVHVVHQNSTVTTLKVSNPGHPFWLVLGQSLDKGWTATLANGTSLGKPTLIDGYANGWYVNPKGMPSTIDVTLRFSPQNAVWAALLASVLAILLCVVLVIVLRRRTRQAGDESSAAMSDYEPSLWSPLVSAGSRPPATTVVVATVVSAAVAAVVVSPWAALVAGPAVLLGLLVPRARWLITLSAAGLLAVTGLYVIQLLFRYKFPPEFEWPAFFTLGNSLAWVAVVLLACDVVVEFGRRGRPQPPG